MNIFSLFEMEDAESIKLGIQVIKTLNKETAFEKHFNIHFEKYCDVFENVFLLINIEADFFGDIIYNLLVSNMDLSRLSNDNVSWVICYYPILMNRFDMSLFTSEQITRVINYQPQLVPYFVDILKNLKSEL